MIMNKSFLLVQISIFLISCAPFESDKGKIIINNKSPYLITDVNIEYEAAGKIDSIGNIASNSSYKYTIQYTDAEDSININYIDRHKKKHSANVVPYAAKYDKQKYQFDIEQHPFAINLSLATNGMLRKFPFSYPLEHLDKDKIYYNRF